MQRTILLAITVLFLLGCGGKNEQSRLEYGEGTRALINLLDDNPDVESMLIKSIEKAHQTNPDPATNPVQNLEEYIEFVSRAEQSLPWDLLPVSNGENVQLDIFQSICLFYFLIDQPLEELEDEGLFRNSLQYAEPYASWVRTFSQSWGKYLETENSWNAEALVKVENDPGFGLQEGWYESPENWSTFNQFFSRRLRSPDQRPIAEPENDAIVVSFADAVPMGVWKIDSNSMITDSEGVAVKSSTIHSVEALIGEESMYKNAFANGTFTHSFLNVNDYHRYHFPVSGTVREVRIIPGISPSGGSLWWDKENGRYEFDPSLIGWQTLETRGCIVLETDNYGLVALLPIGMATVGSVNFLSEIKPGLEVKKGDELGYFLFGGSDFIMLFQEGAEFELQAPKEGNDYQHILMGERLGILNLRSDVHL